MQTVRNAEINYITETAYFSIFHKYSYFLFVTIICLQEQFDQRRCAMHMLRMHAPIDEELKLYALNKQARRGDCKVKG